MTKAEKTRQFIIETSAPIFNKKGVDGTSMSDIMEATKLSKGALYVHFADKEQLSHFAVDHNLNTFVAKSLAAANGHPTAKAKLMAIIDFLSDPLHPPLSGGCPMINFGIKNEEISPAIRQKINKTMLAMQQAIATTIKKGIKTGEFKSDWNAGEFAVKAFALLEGAILISIISGNHNQMKTIVKIIKNEIDEKSV